MAETNLLTQDQLYPYLMQDNSNDEKDMVVVNKQSWLKLRKIEFYEKVEYISCHNSAKQPSTEDWFGPFGGGPGSTYNSFTSTQVHFPKFEAAVETFFTPRFFSDKRYQDLLDAINNQKRVISKMAELDGRARAQSDYKKYIFAAILIEIAAITEIIN